MNKPNIFFRLTKVDVVRREVTGIATAEQPDQTGEICDYESTKPYFQKWSDGIRKATGGKSLGNVREMHSNIAAGKVTDLEFDDAAKAIRIVTKCVDDGTWNKIIEGVLTGFSQGGDYVRKWRDGEFTRYTADPSEISYVDNPCLSTATFEVIKADGTTEMRKFHEQPATTELKPELEQVWKAKDGSTWPTKAEAKKQNQLIAAKEAVAKTTEGVQALMDGINDALDKRDPANSEGDQSMKPEIKKLLKNETWDSATAIHALDMIQSLLTGEEGEADEGDEEAGQVEDLKEAISRIKSFIASEIKEGDDEDDDTSGDDAEKSAQALLQKGEMPPAMMEHVHAIHKAAGHIMKRCMKCMGSAAEKMLKAEDSGDDAANPMDHIAAIHKKASVISNHCIELGSKMDAEDEQDGGDDEAAEKLMKALVENDVMSKAIGGLTAQLTEIQKRLTVVESQPAVRKGKLMTVTRDHERTDEPESAVETRSFNLSGLSPEEARAMLN